MHDNVAHQRAHPRPAKMLQAFFQQGFLLAALPPSLVSTFPAGLPLSPVLLLAVVDVCPPWAFSASVTSPVFPTAIAASLTSAFASFSFLMPTSRWMKCVSSSLEP